MRLTLNEKQPQLTLEDLGTEFVRTGPTVNGDWSFVPYIYPSGIQLEPAKLENITSTHFLFAIETSQRTSRSDGLTIVELDKNICNDDRWITAKKCEKIFQEQPHLFQKAYPSTYWPDSARDPGWLN